MLRVESLSKNFGGLQAISDLSFTLNKGVIKSVIGPNGAGKSTLFNLLSGSLLPSSGKVFYQDNEITALTANQIAAQGIARTFQNIKMFSGMSVLDNVLVGLHLQGSSGFFSSLLQLPKVRREERWLREEAYALLERFGLAEDAKKPAEELSFGGQRSVELARALALSPDLLLLDEPAAGLNIYETAELAEQITAIRDSGITVLLVEHDMSLVMDISDEILVLSFGKKIAEDLPVAIQKNPEVVKIYLGE